MNYVLLVSIALGVFTGYELGDLLADSWFQGNPHAALEGFALTAVVSTAVFQAILQKINLGLALSTILATIAGYQLGDAVSERVASSPSLTDPAAARLVGHASVFGVVWLLCFFVLWPILRRAMEETTHTLDRGYATAKRLGKPARSFEEIEEEIERGLTVDYRGKVDRNFAFHNGQRTAKTRIRASYQLRRNSMAMQPREREALKIWRFLVEHGGISDQEADDMKFALTWGNGSAEVYGGSFRADARMGLKNLRDLVSAEAAERNASTEGAIGQLFTRLHYAATRRTADQEVVRVYETYLPPSAAR